MRQRLLFIPVGLLVISAASLRAQFDTIAVPAYQRAYWATLGIGTSRFGPCGFLGLWHASKSNVFSFRYLTADEFQLNIEGHYAQPDLSLREVDVLYGRAYGEQALVLSISLGLGYVWTVTRGRLVKMKEADPARSNGGGCCRVGGGARPSIGRTLSMYVPAMDLRT